MVGYADHAGRESYVGPCQSPLSAVCRECDGRALWACGNHRASKCVPCADRYHRRVSRLAAHRTPDSGGSRYGYFLTLTAPGEKDHGRWSPGGARRERETCECHTGVELPRWNPAAGETWHRFAVALRRRSAGVQFFRAAEVQKRGALHHHVLLWSDVALDVHDLQALALAAGYGCVIDLQPLQAHHARYVAKYVTKSIDQREDVPWMGERVNKSTGELLEVEVAATFRAWSSSKGWGLTMRDIRDACRSSVAASLTLRRVVSEGEGPTGVEGSSAPLLLAVGGGPAPPDQ